MVKLRHPTIPGVAIEVPDKDKQAWIDQLWEEEDAQFKPEPGPEYTPRFGFKENVND